MHVIDFDNTFCYPLETMKQIVIEKTFSRGETIKLIALTITFLSSRDNETNCTRQYIFSPCKTIILNNIFPPASSNSPLLYNKIDDVRAIVLNFQRTMFDGPRYFLDDPKHTLDGTRAMLDNPYVEHRSNTIRGPTSYSRPTIVSSTIDLI